MPRRPASSPLFAAIGGMLVAFLILPVVALATTLSFSELRAGLTHPLVWPALKLSAFTTCVSLAIVVALGTPLAWTLARARGPIARAAEVVVQLPIVVPPAVAGVALLLAFGRKSPIGTLLYPGDFSVPFTSLAVILAEVFVSAPFYVQAAASAFRRVDPNLIVVARTLGASPFRVFARIAIPLARPGLIAGALISWARSLGEFGATLMFAGNLQGETQTLPLAIYTALESDLRAAQALSLVLLAFAFLLLLLVRTAERAGRHAEDVS